MVNTLLCTVVCGISYRSSKVHGIPSHPLLYNAHPQMEPRLAHRPDLGLLSFRRDVQLIEFYVEMWPKAKQLL